MSDLDADIATLIAEPSAEDEFITGKILSPNTPGPKVVQLPDEGFGVHIMKFGTSVTMCEAEAMRYVGENTTIPVPRVIKAYVAGGKGYIIMSRLEGERLGDVWDSMSPATRLKIIEQLQDMISQLSSLSGGSYGALWDQPCEDIFFKHLPFRHGELTYGPYANRKEYNQGLIEALKRSTPSMNVEAADAQLISHLLAVDDEQKIFCHGDLHRFNILVDKDTGKITGLVDWEAAGFSPRGRDYYEAKSRARRPSWTDTLEFIFPEQEKVHFELFSQLDRALTRYTCI